MELMTAIQLSTGGFKNTVYRAIDSSGLTLDIWLRKKRDRQIAYAFFKRLVMQFGKPGVLVTDNAPSLFSTF